MVGLGRISMLPVPELEAQLNSNIDRRTRIDTLNQLAWDINLKDPEKARIYAGQAYELASSGEFEKEPYLLGIVGGLRSLAALNNDAGSYDTALSQSLRGLEILEGISGGTPETSILKLDLLGTISWTYRSFGDYGVAAEYGMEALRLAQTLGDRRREAAMLNVLSVIYAETNNVNAALEMGKKVMQIHHELGYPRGESIALNNLAMTYLDLGDNPQALEASQESLNLARENGLDTMTITALSTMGEIYLGMKNFTKAEESLLQVLAMARERKIGSEEFQCLVNLGKVYQQLQNDQAALSTLQSALMISHESNDRPGEFECHQLLSEVYERRGEFEAALQHFKQFHILKETVFNENMVKRLSSLQVIHQLETAKREAEIHYLKTIELRREIEERKNAQETLEKLATIDPLTGLLNRREFFLLGEREFQITQQSGQHLTAILLDFDHFKQINDVYGHVIGDQALIQAMKMVRESLRQGEIIGRYGGDEFVILLPGSTCAQGKQIAERLREKVAALTITTPKGDLSLTLSLGIAEYIETHSVTLEVLLDHADQAMYAAKQAGRNRFSVYTC
jgi:diguanylate cyclase (GGDEF)-like protein